MYTLCHECSELSELPVVPAHVLVWRITLQCVVKSDLVEGLWLSFMVSNVSVLAELPRASRGKAAVRGWDTSESVWQLCSAEQSECKSFLVSQYGIAFSICHTLRCCWFTTLVVVEVNRGGSWRQMSQVGPCASYPLQLVFDLLCKIQWVEIR